MFPAVSGKCDSQSHTVTLTLTDTQLTVTLTGICHSLPSCTFPAYWLKLLKFLGAVCGTVTVSLEIKVGACVLYCPLDVKSLSRSTTGLSCKWISCGTLGVKKYFFLFSLSWAPVEKDLHNVNTSLFVTTSLFITIDKGKGINLFTSSLWEINHFSWFPTSSLWEINHFSWFCGYQSTKLSWHILSVAQAIWCLQRHFKDLLL